MFTAITCFLHAVLVEVQRSCRMRSPVKAEWLLWTRDSDAIFGRRRRSALPLLVRPTRVCSISAVSGYPLLTLDLVNGTQYGTRLPVLFNFGHPVAIYRCQRLGRRADRGLLFPKPLVQPTTRPDVRPSTPPSRLGDADRCRVPRTSEPIYT